MNQDDFLAEKISLGKVKAMPGSMICVKHTKNQVVNVVGLGDVTASGITDSGLVLVSKDNKAAETYKAMLFTVLVVGENPTKWDIRKATGKKGRDWKTTFQEQGLAEGTTIAVSVGAGINQNKFSEFIQIRYDEISAIGQDPDDKSVPDMLPAPGWVMVEVVKAQGYQGALVTYEGFEDVRRNGNMSYGRIIGLPRGYKDGEMRVGDVICFPTHGGVGASEFIEFEGGLRCLPMTDVFGVDTSASNPVLTEIPEDHGLSQVKWGREYQCAWAPGFE